MKELKESIYSNKASKNSEINNREVISSNPIRISGINFPVKYITNDIKISHKKNIFGIQIRNNWTLKEESFYNQKLDMHVSKVGGY